MLRIITWNIQWGLGIDGTVDLRRIVDEAHAFAEFDVLCLQEVSDNFTDLKGSRGLNQFAELARLLPGYTAVEGVALDVPDGAGGRRRFGNMILSRLPVAQVLRYTLPWEAASTRNMPRLMLEAVVETPSGPVRVMTTHLEYSAGRLRKAQVEGIREAHRTACERVVTPREDGPGTYALFPTSPSAILTGDFNMRPDDPVKRRISEPFSRQVPALLDAWQVAHGGSPHPTSFCLFEQSNGPPHCCDFMFVTEDLASKVGRIDYNQATQASDHQPVLLELDL
ncbi:endonuclease/exonuclease/phosphatase family protein [Microvirga sp. 3-52]|uniref:endonuclease/exonuclease/phosphatase family protein n=1 Tax=Microvirga sp. 3-52 TaxID=2792425 RepID=UPI001AD0B1DA|nr:endonuclease/exonuclease/phosphatase family protein [Microvirga sp. 3-52]MBO1903837.1 endonuclease/exonuclease/phosphatase family protein [Microvirga sp. 3-52]MBS7451257.1 endonuclease/exonuclease/phosphatase family protein [Microvirga sp. 3-52]